jgi:GDP-D-mannose dehydratase
MSQRVALITGITGQDGAYLARFLLTKGYAVHGTSRDAALARLDGLIALGIREKVRIYSMFPSDFRSVAELIERVAPDEIYNLSGQSSVALSFTQPAETLESIVFGTLNVLETLRRVGSATRLYNAGSSECFGDTGMEPANERRSGPRALMVSPRRRRSPLSPTTATPMGYLPVRASFSATSRRSDRVTSSPVRSRLPPPGLRGGAANARSRRSFDSS